MRYCEGCEEEVGGESFYVPGMSVHYHLGCVPEFYRDRRWYESMGVEEE